MTAVITAVTAVIKNSGGKMLSTFMTDKIIIQKTDGREIRGIKAYVQKEKIFVEGPDHLFDTGDLIARKNQGGAWETFEVTIPRFYKSLQGLAPHYQLEVRKLEIKELYK